MYKHTNLLYSSEFCDKLFSKAVTSSILWNGKNRCIFNVFKTGSWTLFWLTCFSNVIKLTFKFCICNEIVVITVYSVKTIWKLVTFSKHYQERVINKIIIEEINTKPSILSNIFLMFSSKSCISRIKNY